MTNPTALPAADPAGAPAAPPAGEGPEQRSRSLDRSLLHGAAWSTGTKTVSQVVSWMSTLVVARLLTPADYGIFGMAMLYVGLVQFVTEFGIGTAIVSRPELEREDFRQLNSISVGAGVVAAIVVCVTAPLVALYFRAPRVVPVLAALSLTFIVSAFRTVPWALLQRDLRFRRLAVYDAAQAILLSLGSIALAWMGYGYWTLVGAALASALFGTVVSLRYHNVGFSRPRLDRLRGTLTLGADLVVQRLTWWGYSNADFAVAGRVLGRDQLGAYTLAWTLANQVADRVGAMIMQVVPGVLARVHDDRVAMLRYVTRISEVLALVLMPICVGVALVAPEAVHGVLGKQWVIAIPALQILSLFVATRATLAIFNQVLILLGRQRLMTRANVVLLLVLPPSFVFASRWGITGIATVWFIVFPPVALYLSHVSLRLLDSGLGPYLREAFWPAVSASLVMTGAVLGARTLLPESWPAVVRLLVLIATGALAYPGALALLHHARVRALLGWFRANRS